MNLRADVKFMQGVAKEFISGAETMRQVIQFMHRTIQLLRATVMTPWKEAYIQLLLQAIQRLTTVMERLLGFAQTLMRNAGEQEQVSRSGGALAGVPSSGGAGGGAPASGQTSPYGQSGRTGQGSGQSGQSGQAGQAGTDPMKKLTELRDWLTSYLNQQQGDQPATTDPSFGQPGGLPVQTLPAEAAPGDYPVGTTGQDPPQASQPAGPVTSTEPLSTAGPAPLSDGGIGSGGPPGGASGGGGDPFVPGQATLDGTEGAGSPEPAGRPEVLGRSPVGRPEPAVLASGTGPTGPVALDAVLPERSGDGTSPWTLLLGAAATTGAVRAAVSQLGHGPQSVDDADRQGRGEAAVT